MANPYLPDRDADFDAWLVNFSTLLTAAPTNYGLIAADATAVSTVKNAWVAAYALSTNPATRTAATVADKDAARASAEATVRPYAIRIRNNSSVSDLLKVGIGVTIPSFPPSPIPVPTSQVDVTLLRAIPLEWTLAYKEPFAVGKAKPFGAIGVEFWIGIGTVPAISPAQCVYRDTFTKSPSRVGFLPADQGKIGTIFARWVTRSGPGGVAQKGPWSTALSAVIM